MSAPEETPAVNRKLLILLGAVAALALLAVFVVMPLLTSDPLEEVELASPPSGEPDPDADALPDADEAEDADADAEDDAEDDDVDESFEVFTARDPFKQLVVPTVAEEAPEGAPPADGQAPASGEVPANGEVPADSQAPADATAPASGPAPAEQAPEPTNADRAEPPAQEQIEVDIVELVDVYRDGKKDKAQVTVNDKGYDVAVNERFADHYQLLSVDGDCATFLYGDNRFVLCAGDTVRK